MGRRPRSNVCTSLRELLSKVSTQTTGSPYRFKLYDEELFIWTTSTSNAVRICAYHLGATATPVSPGELVECLQGLAKEKT